MEKFLILMLFLIVSITLGTTWTAMKIVIQTIPPIFGTGMRFLLASPLLFLLCYLNNSPLLFPVKKRFNQVILGIFCFTLPFFLILYSGVYISSFFSSIIFSTMPVFISIISIFYLKKKICFLQIFGIIISIISFLIILFLELSFNNIDKFKGVIALLLAVICNSYSYVYTEKNKDISILTFNTLPSFFTGFFLLIISFFLENPSIKSFSLQSILATIYLGNVIGIFGMLSLFYLQKKVNSFYTSMIFLFLPFIVELMEKYLYGYIFSIYEFFFLIFLMLGIILTILPKNYLKIF